MTNTLCGISICSPVGFRNVIENEVADLTLDIAWLVTDGDLARVRKDITTCGSIRTFVNPGRSTKVKSSTFGLYIRKDIGSLLTPLF